MTRSLTESQYVALREYAGGQDRWVNGGPPPSLIVHGFITCSPHDRQMFRITDAGRAALAAFRARHGIAS